jgi:hypothetical protein
MPEIRRLPLWRNLLEKITEEGLNYGNSYDAGRFEKELSCSRNSRSFGIAVHKIRVELENKGYYLQGHAIKDGSLVIVAPEKNSHIAKLTESKIRRHRGRSVRLLTATDVSLLKPKELAAHVKVQNRVQIVAMIERRIGKIHRFLKAKKPELLRA